MAESKNIETPCPTCLKGKVKPNSRNVITVDNFDDDEDTRLRNPNHLHTKYTVCDDCYKEELKNNA